MSLMLSVAVQAQNHVTHFLGIPVDGSKSEMMRKLRLKGFKSATVTDLQGEFNGSNVGVSVVTNNRKVWRIVLIDDVCCDEQQVKVRFNKLCQQFVNNAKYESIQDYTIPEDEDISYKMTVKDTVYEAVFLQKVSDISFRLLPKDLKDVFYGMYTENELNHPTSKMKEIMLNMKREYYSSSNINRKVWFKIIKDAISGYRIAMYYDNEYNCANGEDL